MLLRSAFTRRSRSSEFTDREYSPYGPHRQTPAILPMSAFRG